MSATNAVPLERTYRGVQNDVEMFIQRLRGHPHDPAFFYRLRDQDIDGGTDARGRSVVYLLEQDRLQWCLSRHPRQPLQRALRTPRKSEHLRRAHVARLLGGPRESDLRVEDFEVVVEKANPGDFVYFDPPYVPLSAASSFTSYTSNGFGHDEQTRLRDTARRLKERGVQVLLSNSSAPSVRELHAGGFDLVEVSAARFVNSQATARGPVVELLMT